MKSWSLIVEPKPLPGAWNMAVDERLFDLARRAPRTFLRFYRWERPTASLGYSQDPGKVIDLDFCRRHRIDVVRRMTGGKLVLHHREVTYSLSSSDTGLFTGTLRESYHLISRALLKGLELMGLEARLAEAPPQSYARGTMPCFAYAARDEIEVDGRKIVGSAQKRLGPSFLPHGSIPLEKDEALLAGVSRPGGSEAGHCEIDAEVPCAWQLIYDRLKSMDRLDTLLEIQPPKRWRTSRDGGPRKIVRQDLRLPQEEE